MSYHFSFIAGITLVPFSTYYMWSVDLGVTDVCVCVNIHPPPEVLAGLVFLVLLVFQLSLWDPEQTDVNNLIKQMFVLSE